MARANTANASKEARRRTKIWEAKKAVNDQQRARRVRDDIAAVVVGIVVVGLAVTAQSLYFGVGPGATPGTSASPSASASTAASASSASAPSPSVAEGRTWSGTLTLDSKPIGIKLYGDKAPQAVASFISLAQSGFYSKTSCHRLTVKPSSIFVLQCGDPKGDGSGGPGYSFGPIENAPSDQVYRKGSLAMARQTNAASSMGSQFFIVYADSTIPNDSAGGYTVFGEVTSGLSVLDPIVAGGVAGATGDGSPRVAATINSVSVE